MAMLVLDAVAAVRRGLYVAVGEARLGGPGGLVSVAMLSITVAVSVPGASDPHPEDNSRALTLTVQP